MRYTFTLFVICFLSFRLTAQLNPTVTSWIINTTNAKGYANIPSNVQKVEYSTNNVYISCTCIPGYDIGPWQGNPNIPSNQNFVFKITRNPQQNSGTPVTVALGHTGVWTNGVSMFNPRDAMSYQNKGVWNQNAIVVEGPGFDTCLGHPAPNGEYHHHLNPRCLYNYRDNTKHSPIIGWAFDGFPIYGAYGYANSNGTGGIKRMESSFRKRNITTRTILPDGSTASSAGPNISAQFPLGYYVEDFEFVNGLGDLDIHNGRFCVTPEYPAGIYAYFVTLDSTLTAAYPYTLGETYYGTVQSGNTGPGSGHNSVTETVTTYNPNSGINSYYDVLGLSVYPNPAKNELNIQMNGIEHSCVYIYSLTGQLLLENTPRDKEIHLNISKLNTGIYLVRVVDENGNIFESKFIKVE